MSKLKRLVKMELKAGCFAEFKKIFEYGQHVVIGSKGCHSVSLLQDDENPNIVFTYSEWDSEEDLDNYRNSEAFRGYWPKIKGLLDKKTEVWNLSLQGEKKNK